MASPDTLTLDEARDAFYVAQRACERHAAALAAFVALLDDKKAAADAAWLGAVHEEARKALVFHGAQAGAWDGFVSRADAYTESVKQLGEAMALAGARVSGAPWGHEGRGGTAAWGQA